MSVNFGKYDVPPTLQTLISLQNVLGDDEQFYLCLNFYLSLEDFRYFNTPSDVVVFGNLGVDGIHYGFLSDYGSVPNLEEAPIVCVMPMDFERPTRIVAKNLREFLRVNWADSELFYNQFGSEEDYLEASAQWVAEGTDALHQESENEKLVRGRVANFLMENIEIPIIDNPYRYVQKVELERQKNVSIQTLDRLGVVTPILRGEEHILFLIHERTDPDLELLQEYFDSAPIASRLALFRDIQLNYIFPDNQELYKIVVDEMVKMGLINEVARLSEDI